MSVILNNIKTTTRALLKHRNNTIINLLGLSIGVAGALMLLVLYSHFSGYDKYHDDYQRIFRVNTHDNFRGELYYSMGVQAILPTSIENKIPEIENSVFFSGVYSADKLITIPKKGGNEEYFQLDGRENVAYTSGAFFEIFSREILRGGKKEKLLNSKNEAVISESIALKWFGSTDVIGNDFILDGHDTFVITGVMEDYRNDTGFPFDIFLSYITIKEEKEEPGWTSLYSDDTFYVKLKNSDRKATVDSQIAKILEDVIEEDPADAGDRNFYLQPLVETHTDKRFSNYNYRTISDGTLQSLIVISILLLLTACVNFINLSTAVANKRSKEVGVRKVLGSSRKSLVIRFLLETSIITLAALMIAYVIDILLLGKLNDFLEIKIDASVFLNGNFIVFLIFLWFVLTILAGLYPALLLSGFKPAITLKGRFNYKGSFSYNLRRILVGSQFFISQAFIICTIIMISQMSFFKNHDLGYNKSGIIVMDLPYQDIDKAEQFKNEALKYSGITNAALGMSSPGSGSVSSTGISVEGSDRSYNVQVKVGDKDYIDTYNFRIIEGEGLVRTDSANRFVVNETFLKETGYSNPSEIIGKMITVWGTEAPVTGVVKDFHAQSLKRKKEPIVMLVRPQHYYHIGFKVAGGNIPGSVEHLKKVYKSIYPKYTFDYNFLDDYLNVTFYADDERLTTIFSIFSGVAIFIGCLGLFGLISYMAEQKMKEISIRKVLGASENQLMWVFSGEFLKLLLISSLISFPVSYLVMNRYLEEYVYKITISPMFFVAGLIVTALIAFGAIAFRSYKTTRANPVVALKDE
ncbi:ABC transporter permease [Marinigracilibium pacificum]|uniref:FtsX-like permease family protein n=1 Tax=Marinigracilibium pacificum TaxID=2729599 RepID=A0A848J6N2_9BACT|nr:ABC transporter permease [Marinigracilibium pacificum]NMM50114.1 FtsX-like permease family protein [Marinigracilibium pacificum]